MVEVDVRQVLVACVVVACSASGGGPARATGDGAVDSGSDASDAAGGASGTGTSGSSGASGTSGASGSGGVGAAGTSGTSGSGGADAGSDAPLDGPAVDAATDSATCPVDRPLCAMPRFTTLHETEVMFDGAFADQALDVAVDLGFTGIRFDVRWRLVEPARDAPDANGIAFYKDFAQRIVAKGLEPMVVLSSPPDWALTLRATDSNAFFAEFEAYVRSVVSDHGAATDHYQTWNEANHIIDPIPASEDARLFSTAGAVIRSDDPTAKIHVNAMANQLGWEAAITDWVTQSGAFIDVIGIDHYPGTWCCIGMWEDWAPLDTLIARLANPADPWSGRQGAVMETGFSSWSAVGASETDQRDWIQTSLRVMRQKMHAAETARPGTFALFGFYQLVNAPELAQEGNFGIVKADLAQKAGYGALRHELGQL